MSGSYGKINSKLWGSVVLLVAIGLSIYIERERERNPLLFRELHRKVADRSNGVVHGHNPRIELDGCGLISAKNDTRFIHIGKAGGSTIRSVLQGRKRIATVIHVSKPSCPRASGVDLIVLRNPIDRFVSAFYWRKDLVVTKGSQRNRFKGEYALFQTYNTPQKMADLFVMEKKSSNRTHTHLPYVHHIIEDISWYLKDYLISCVLARRQKVCIITTETLAEDMADLYQIQLGAHEKNNQQNQESLSNKTCNTIYDLVGDDFEIILAFASIGLIRKNQLPSLLNSKHCPHVSPEGFLDKIYI